MRSSDWSSDVCSSDLGSLAPDGAIVKVAGMHRLQFSGPARVFDCEEEAFAAVENREISEGSVIVIRYEGPKGGPGMREMLSTTAALYGQGLGEKVALVTDGSEEHTSELQSLMRISYAVFCLKKKI